MKNIEIVREFYNSQVEHEWQRLHYHPFEFIITRHYLDKYIKPGDKVLDIGGGPGRYSLYLAESGCDVTLFDLSEANVAFALSKAEEQGLKLKAISGDARFVDELISEKFDHILIMGPMYHLLEEADRVKCINSALKLLNDNGMIFVSFISLYAGMCFMMKYQPELLVLEKEEEYINCYLENKIYAGNGFTKMCMLSPDDIECLMKKFPLKKLHLFGQEGITAPCEDKINGQSKEVVDKWLQIAIQTCERSEFLSYSEHLMYVGRKV